MRIFIIITGLFFLTTSPVKSQERIQRNAGKLEAYKIAYFTNRLNLTPEEAQKFWPLYNKYVTEIKEIKMQNRQTDEIDMEEKIINVRKKYKNEFTRALPVDRVNQFFKVDKEFNAYLRRELQERHHLNQNKRQFKQ